MRECTETHCPIVRVRVGVLLKVKASKIMHCNATHCPIVQLCPMHGNAAQGNVTWLTDSNKMQYNRQ